MSWSAFGAIGELVGAVAVVASLVYLSRQVRQNTAAVRTANAAGVQSNMQQLARVLHSDRPLGALVLQTMSGELPENPEDRLAVWAYFFDMLKTAELAHRHYLRGDLEPDLWEASLAFYRAYFETPGFRAYGESGKSHSCRSDGPLRQTHEMIHGAAADSPANAP